MPGVLTEGLERAGRDAEVPAARSSGDSWRRRWTEVAVQGAGCFSETRIPPNQSFATLWKCCGVRKVANYTGGVEFR